MNYLSICSGIEAASVAFGPLGWKPLAFSEIEAFPRAVLQHHYPDTPLHGDFTELKDQPFIVDADLLCGGTPCFVAGHMVLTAAGYRPIEDVRAGDMVMTHAGRLRRVIRHGTKSATVGTLRGVGLSEGIVCTEDHPFLSVQHRMQNTRRDGVYAKIEHTGAPEWIAAKDMPGRQWCALLNYEAMPHEPRSTKFDTRTCMYLAGFYLGDGWVRSHGAAKKKSVLFGINRAKYEVLRPWLGNVAHTVTNEPTSVRVAIHDTALAIWLMTEFGSGAHNKHIPAWVMGHRHRRELMRGYLDTDGSRSGDHYTVNSVSRSLAFGASDLLNAEGFVASVAKVETDDTTVIDGRTVNQSDYYSVRAFLRSKSRKSRERHGLLLRKVTGYEPGIMRDTVYNIEVEEDNSYILDGAIVHNCQAFSVAGNRQSLADDRGNLTLQFVLLADAIDHLRSTAGRPPAWILYENVPGILNTKDNAFGALLGGLCGSDTPIVAPAGWGRSGVVNGPSRTVAYRVLNAEFFGLAQRRKRVFVLAKGGAGRWAAADALLPIIESSRWHPAPSRSTGKGVAATIGCRAGGGGDLNPETSGGGNLIAHTLRGEGFDTNEDGTGRGVPLVPDVAGTMKAGAESGGWSNSADHAAAGYMVPVVMATGQAGAEVGGDGSPSLTCNHKAPIVFDPTLSSRPSGGGGLGTDFDLDEGLQAIAIQERAVSENPDAGPQGKGWQNDVGFTLEARHQSQFVAAPIVMATGQASAMSAPTLSCNHEAPILMRMREGKEGGGKGPLVSEDQSLTLATANDQVLCDCKVGQRLVVRRLVPEETEALQGFPRGYTRIPWRGKPAEECPDGNRYKAIGNSWAVPVVRWIGERIHIVDTLPTSDQKQQHHA